MELVIEGVVGVLGAATAISAYRGLKRRRLNQEDDDLLTPAGALAGRTVLLTGANTGIGHAAAELLARKGATVVCACRDAAKAQQAADAINARLDRLRRQQQQQQQQDTPSSQGGATATLVPASTTPPPVTIGGAEPAPAPLDLGSLQSVRAFADAYRRSGRPLHVLVNNAAAMFPRRELVDAWEEEGGQDDEEGDAEVVMRRPVERTMMVNHLGPWLLTSLLLPTLKDTGRREGSPARVIFVSSRLEGRGGSARFLEAWLQDPAMEPPPTPTPAAPTSSSDSDSPPTATYTAFAAYGASKLANLLTTQHLDRQRLGWALSHPHPSPHAPTSALPSVPSTTPSAGDNTLAASPPWDPSDQHVCVYACTPGMVHTQLNRLAPWALRAAFFPFSWALLQTPQQGARPIVFLATSERVEGRGGGFWGTSKDKQQPFEVVEVPSSPESQDAVLAHRLWTLSEELAAPFLGPLAEEGPGKK